MTMPFGDSHALWADPNAANPAIQTALAQRTIDLDQLFNDQAAVIGATFADMSGAEMKVVYAIHRYCIMQRTRYFIGNIPDLARMTKLTHPSIYKGIRDAVARGVMQMAGEGRNKTFCIGWFGEDDFDPSQMDDLEADAQPENNFPVGFQARPVNLFYRTGLPSSAALSENNFPPPAPAHMSAPALAPLPPQPTPPAHTSARNNNPLADLDPQHVAVPFRSVTPTTENDEPNGTVNATATETIPMGSAPMNAPHALAPADVDALARELAAIVFFSQAPGKQLPDNQHQLLCEHVRNYHPIAVEKSRSLTSMGRSYVLYREKKGGGNHSIAGLESYIRIELGLEATRRIDRPVTPHAATSNHRRAAAPVSLARGTTSGVKGVDVDELSPELQALLDAPEAEDEPDASVAPRGVGVSHV